MAVSLNPAITGDAPTYNGSKLDAIAEALGSDADEADDDTVIGQLKQIALNTAA